MTTVKYLIYSVLVYGFGILIGTFISLIPIFLSGVSFMEYFNGVWLILLKHGPGPSLLHRIQFFRQLWLESRFVYFYPFLLLLVLQGNLLKNKYILGLLIWLFLDFVGVNASGYYFGHQLKQIMPSLSLIIGILIANSLYKHIVKKDIFKKHINRIAVVVIFFLLPYDLLIDNYLRIRQDNYIHSDKEVGLFIKNNTNHEDYLFFLCNANAVLAYSDRVTSSKHFCPLFINYPDEYNEVYSDLLNKPPKLIIRRELDIWHFPAKFEDYVEQNYSLFHKQYDFLIYKRNL